MQDLEIMILKYSVMELVAKFKLMGKWIFFLTLLCFVATLGFVLHGAEKSFHCKKTAGAISWEKAQLTVKIIQNLSLIVK